MVFKRPLVPGPHFSGAVLMTVSNTFRVTVDVVVLEVLYFAVILNIEEVSSSGRTCPVSRLSLLYRIDHLT